MCLALYRAETIYFASDAFEWASGLDWATMDDWDPVAMEKSIQEYIVGRSLAMPALNVFQAKNTLCNETTAFHLRQKPNAEELSLQDVQWRHDVPNFTSDLYQHFLGSRSRRDADLPFSSLSTWWRVRVQCRDPQDSEVLLPPQVIQASPPLKIGETAYSGRYNFVLLRRGSASNLNLNNSGEDYGIQGGISNSDSSTRWCLRMFLTKHNRVYYCSIEGYLCPGYRLQREAVLCLRSAVPNRLECKRQSGPWYSVI